MAYFRGDIYIWDGEGEPDEMSLHLWNRNGYDGWDLCYEDEDGQRIAGWENASGVSIPENVIGRFVMMRLARPLVEKTPAEVERIIDEAAEVGNFRGAFLKQNAPALKNALSALKLGPPQRD